MSAQTLAVELSADAGPLVAGLRAGREEINRFTKQAHDGMKRYDSDMQAGVSSTGKFGRQVQKTSADSARALQKQHQAMSDVGRVSTVVGATVLAGLGLAAKASMDFEKNLSGLQAATRANAAAMDLLREAAIRTGKDTMFSATEAAQAQTELSKAGLSVSEILGGALTGAVNLAAAGQLGIAESAEIAAGAMKKFGLTGGDVAHIADLLAAGAGKALGSVQDLGAALTQSGGIAANMGFSIEETVAALSMFAEAGYIGSDAGTSFKQMLLSFTPASDEAAAAMDRYGLSFYDAQGNLKSFTEIAGTLEAGLGSLTDQQQAAALKTIFGSDAYRVAAVAMEGGAEAATRWIRAVDDTGFAAETARIQTDNLAGDLERLGGSFETALIGSGTTANDTLRALVQTADGAVSVFGELPGPVQATATAVAALVGATTLAGGAFLIGAPKVAAFKSSLDDLGPRSQRVGKGLLGVGAALGGPWGIALAGGITALGLFAKAKGDAKAQVDAFTTAIEADSGAIGTNARQVAVLALEQQGVLASADRLGLSLKDVTDAALGDTAALGRLQQAQSELEDAALNAAGAAVEQNRGLTETEVRAGEAAGAANSLVGDVENLAGATEEAQAAARRNAEALGEEKTATEGATGATQQLAQAAQDAVKALDDQAAALRAQYDPVFAMQRATQQHAEAQKALTEAISNHGGKSSEAQEAQWDLLASTVGLSAASDTLMAAVEGGTVSLGKSKAQLATWVQQGLLTQSQADTLAGKISGVTTEADRLSTTPAAAKVSDGGTVDPVAAKIRDLQSEMEGLNSRPAKANVLPGADVSHTRTQLQGVSALLDRLDRNVVANVTTIYRSIGAPGAAPVNRTVGVGGGVIASHATGGRIDPAPWLTEGAT